jgi:hypothetical protein
MILSSIACASSNRLRALSPTTSIVEDRRVIAGSSQARKNGVQSIEAQGREAASRRTGAGPGRFGGGACPRDRTESIGARLVEAAASSLWPRPRALSRTFS